MDILKDFFVNSLKSLTEKLLVMTGFTYALSDKIIENVMPGVNSIASYFKLNLKENESYNPIQKGLSLVLTFIILFSFSRFAYLRFKNFFAPKKRTASANVANDALKDQDDLSESEADDEEPDDNDTLFEDQRVVQVTSEIVTMTDEGNSTSDSDQPLLEEEPASPSDDSEDSGDSEENASSTVDTSMRMNDPYIKMYAYYAEAMRQSQDREPKPGAGPGIGWSKGL